MEHGPRYRYALVIHVRRSVCECAHVFTLKREARITARSPVKRKRTLESMEDTLRRKEKNRTRMASMRASETAHIKLHKKRKNKEAMANARTRLCPLKVPLLHSILKSYWDLALQCLE